MNRGVQAFLLLLLCATSVSCGRHDCSGEEKRHGREGGERQLEYRDAKEAFRSEGGALRIYSESIDAFQPGVDVGVAELTLEREGLLLPLYSDSPAIGYVLGGRGRFGVDNSVQGGFRRQYVSRIKRGDVIAIPKGFAFWMYNDGDEQLRVVCVADSSEGVTPGRRQNFGLAGRKSSRFGSVIQGFSRDVIAAAWGVEEETVRTLLEGQEGSFIVRARERITFPDFERSEQEEEENPFHHFDGEFKHSLRRDEPDVAVKDGGWLKTLSASKLPILSKVGFAAHRVRLEKNGICAPAWFGNANQIIYVLRGSGRIQVVSNEGERILDTNAKEGSVIVIPRYFPAVKVAGDEGMDYIQFLTSHRPSPSFLAGENSVYNGIPKGVLDAAFGADKETMREVRRSSAGSSIILAPRSSSKKERREDDFTSSLEEVIASLV